MLSYSLCACVPLSRPVPRWGCFQALWRGHPLVRDGHQHSVPAAPPTTPRRRRGTSPRLCSLLLLLLLLLFCFYSAFFFVDVFLLNSIFKSHPYASELLVLKYCTASINSTYIYIINKIFCGLSINIYWDTGIILELMRVTAVALNKTHVIGATATKCVRWCVVPGTCR